MALAEAWLYAPEGTMPPIEQAKLWGLRQALRKIKEPDDQYSWMAEQVTVRGGGNPSREASIVLDFVANTNL